MGSYTTRLGLYKPATDGSEDVNVSTDLDDNWDRLEAKVGAIACTSGTRPGTPYNGQFIRETDTGDMRVWDGAAWTLVLFANNTTNWPGAFSSERAGATNTIVSGKVTGDTQSRVLVQADGKILIGSGSAGQDTNLYRSAANMLKTDDGLTVTLDLTVSGAVAVTGDAVIGGISFSDRARGIIGRYRRSTVSSTSASTTLVSVIRIDDVPILSGRLYRIWYRCHFDSTVADDQGRAELRYTTDASTPTTSSTLLPGSYAEAVVRTTGTRETRTAVCSYTPGANQTLSLILAVSRQAGSGNITLHADASGFDTEVWIEDCGVDPGSSGTST